MLTPRFALVKAKRHTDAVASALTGHVHKIWTKLIELEDRLRALEEGNKNG